MSVNTLFYLLDNWLFVLANQYIRKNSELIVDNCVRINHGNLKIIIHLARNRIHCDNDQAAIIVDHIDPELHRKRSIRVYMKFGVLHRDNDQPAIVDSKYGKSWHQFGCQHRIGQPAFHSPEMDMAEWWEYGEFIKFEEI